MLLAVFRAQIGTRSPSPDPELRIRYIAKNPPISKSVFKAQKTRQKRRPKASKKRPKSTPKFIKNDFHEKPILQDFPCENLDLEVPSIEHYIQKSIKRWPGNKLKQKM